ncbi:MAG: tetratricopeptide repeat protein [Planctomycetes bacterium]|nr:tetratricopeptide repeat protein [Planctomycetota bacterium]
MSRYPDTAVGSNSAREYIKAANKIRRMAFDGRKSWSGRERNCLFLNTGTRTFADISAVSGFDFLDDGRAMAAVDWDLDGDLDVWLLSRTAPQIRFVRNDTPPANGFLALRLVGDGNRTNRDAIGARVEITLNSRPDEKLIKTLRAGEGFISQSSKWVHFGVGADQQIQQLVVIWPGGEKQRWNDLKARRFYKLVQGDPQAHAWDPPQRTLHLTPSELPVTTPSGSAHTVLAKRLPLPRLEYQDADGSSRVLPWNGRGPLLVNLWASWCKPCVGELREFSRHEQALRAKGLEILALNIDMTRTDVTSDVEAGRKLLESMNFPFNSGEADQKFLTKAEILVQTFFIGERPLPIPTSLLIDDRGRLAAVYRGAVSVERLLKDIDKLSVAEADIRKAALPFAGRDHDPENLLNHATLAARFAEAGFTDDATRLLGGYEARVESGQEESGSRAHYSAHYNLGVALAKGGRPLEAIVHYQRTVQLKPDFLTAHYNLAALQAQQQQTGAAIKHYRRVLQIDPTYVKAHNNLGLIFKQQRDIAGAEHHFRSALKIDPRHLGTLNNLGNLLVQAGKYDDAIAQFRRALDVDGRDARTRYNLGVAFVRQERFQDAADSFRIAVEIDPKHFLAHYNLAAALVRLGRIVEADAAVRRAIEVKPIYGPSAKLHALIQRLKQQKPE